MTTKQERVVMCCGSWQEITLRKGKNKICRDMFITEYHDNHELGIVKNGNLVERKTLTVKEKNSMVNHYNLEALQDGVFRHAKTYRTPQSNNLVQWLLSTCT